MARKKINWRKLSLYVFLVLFVIGFTVPGFLDFGDENQQKVFEKRFCQNDADCYLICADVPTKVFCSENLCQQNSCEEEPIFPLSETPSNFRLEVVLSNETGNQTLNLEEISNPKDIFIKFSGDNVQLYSSGLSLSNILEKVNLPKKKFNLFINGNQSYSTENYVPEEGDDIKLVYS